MSAPMTYRYEGEGQFNSLPRFRAEADATFVIGELYQLERIEERSWNTHAHQFAWLHEAWKNIPEQLAELYPTAEHLRKRALIDTGWYNETLLDAGSRAAALRVLSFVQSEDAFCYAFVQGVNVIIRKAKSQSVRAMGAKDFQKSKSDIMDLIAEMIGVKPSDLERNAGRAA